MTSTKDLLFSKLGELKLNNDDKVSVIGTPDVGISVAICLVMQEISSDVVLIDADVNKIEGGIEDNQITSSFLTSKIRNGQDFSDTFGSKVCIITAGARHPSEESRRIDLVHKNTVIIKQIIPKIIKFSPETILVITTHPVDVMTWVAWKISGFPKHRVIGSGRVSDSARFSFFVGEKLGVAADSVDGLIIGEHGESSVAVWSHLSVSGICLRDINPNIAKLNDEEDWKSVHKKVIEASHDTNELVGFKNWAEAISVAKIAKAILENTNKILPVSTYIKGNCGIEHEIFLSLPAVIGKDGVSSIVDLDLSTEEKCQLKFSAHKVLDVISQLKDV